MFRGFTVNFFDRAPGPLRFALPPSFRLFWFFWGAKKGHFFWVEAKKVGRLQSVGGRRTESSVRDDSPKSFALRPLWKKGRQ